MARKKWKDWLSEDQPEVAKRVEVVEHILNGLLEDAGYDHVIVARDDDDNLKHTQLVK